MARIEFDRILRTALAYHQTGQLARAEALYRQILAQHPDHDGALHWLGVLALQNQRYDLAIESMRRASLIQPNVPAYHGNLGNALAAQGDLDEAVACYRRCLELNPDLAEAHSTLGNALMGLGKADEAIACYRRALELMPDYAAAHNNLGNALRSQGQLGEAVACYRRALELMPDDAEAHNNLGNALKELGQFDEAVACYRRVLERNPGYAETHNSLGHALKDQGKLDEAVACYRRALELKPDEAETHNDLGNALMGLGKVGEAAACYHRAVQRKPGSAAAHNNLGNALADRGNLDDAAACYRRALELKPDYAEAHYNLGHALREQGKLDEAVACYNRTLELKPDDADALISLGSALTDQGKPEEAIVRIRRALALKPGYDAAHNNLGIAHKGQGKLDEAEADFNEAVRVSSGAGEPYFNRAMLRLLRGDFVRGWAEYEWRWKTKMFSARRRAIAQPQWDGSPLEGRTILLHAEQGFGDTIQFIRYARSVAEFGGDAIVECQPPLKRLLQYALKKMPVVDYRQPLPPFDVHCPLLSLPMICGTTMQTIPRQVPYIEAESEAIAQWRDRLANEAGAFKVGLAWAGNKSQKNDHNRSMALSALAPLGHVPGVRFYSLQKDEPGQQALQAPAEMRLIDRTAELADFADTAGLIANLDLVISVDTAVAHLAGAMGKPVWTLLCFAADWRYLLERADCPWYPTMRLFRQSAPGDWSGVAARAAAALREAACDV